MKHNRLKADVLLLVLGMGAMGAPLLGPLLTALEESASLSRAGLTLGYFLLTVAGAIIGLACGVVMRRTARTTFVRAGGFLFCGGCALLAMATPAPGWALMPLAVGCLLIFIGRPLASAANGIFADLWDASPHTGLILLHMTNSFGKLLAPVVVLVLGSALWRSGTVYAVFFGLLAVHSVFWPRASVQHLAEMEAGRELDRRIRLPKDPMVWVCALQFAFIAGSEAGATVILGCFVEKLRASPFDWLTPAAWGRTAIAVMLAGIVAGRVVFALLSRRLSARAIIAICLAGGLFAVPAALGASPWVYVPSLFVTGICFSATWPAFFGITAHAYPEERTFLSVAGGGLANVVGMGAIMYMTGAIGGATARLPWAFLAGVAMMAPFAVFLFATPWGWRLVARPAGQEG